MIAAGQAMGSDLFGMKAEQKCGETVARYKFSSSICLLQFDLFAAVLAMLPFRGCGKPAPSIVCLCRCSRSQCGTWCYGDIQTVVLLTV